MTEPVYAASEDRYQCGMRYRRCGDSGVLLPEISLGLWQNFGDTDILSKSRQILHYAFDHGITHFDLANNYGPPFGAAEENFGRIMKKSFAPYRDELFISTKAGHDMWPGPYGGGCSRKHMISSLNQSLKRMNLDYVDVYYIHRYDPRTDLEETLSAMVDLVHQGKTLYVGISKFPKDAAIFAHRYLAERDILCLLYQCRHNILNRDAEKKGILEAAKKNGAGFITFSPLAQGLLTNRYLNGIPQDSRVVRSDFLDREEITEELLSKIRKLNEIALRRGQSLAQMAMAWVLKDNAVDSAIVGCSSVAQLTDSLKALENKKFTEEELDEIEKIVKGE
ncbi:aldo/keto reductase [uncultured Alistipes sp.]|jgi:hypothetical protein|uniref:aldo/keto reductase n=1 Tax=uncultured Alistipes sp. TaxID=538949 RepID=UPI0025D43D43|nr:aldo/keto reductase [uncultured Alistipes sp.]